MSNMFRGVYIGQGHLTQPRKGLVRELQCLALHLESIRQS